METDVRDQHTQLTGESFRVYTGNGPEKSARFSGWTIIRRGGYY